MPDDAGTSGSIHPFKGKTRKEGAAILLFPVFIAAVIFIAVIFRHEIKILLDDKERFRAWLSERGEWGIPLFILIQFIQVVIFIIPGEAVQILGGFAFGTFQGMLWSIVGIAAGSIVNFYVARALGRPFIDSIAGKDRIAKFNALMVSTRGESAFFLFFLIPGIPKDLLCYAAGLSRLSFVAFFALSTLGRLPGIAVSAIMGDAAGDGRWTVFIVIAAVSIALLAIGIMFRDKLHALVERLAVFKRKRDDHDEDRTD